ncbi:MAG: 23S rRNA (adenine(2503)-C(2))-methyltransferase RlmN [Clostridia bacterium]|nr:23S rRNA (adenine(2503)-C(2))-methyltransferase RlmN [Clostridia bacterium]
MDSIKQDIKSMYLEELESKLTEDGYEKYRAAQIYKWLKKGVKNFSYMHNISKKLSAYLDNNYYISVLNIEKKLKSEYDDTVKYLFRLYDDKYVEAVVMKYKHGYSMCISTQVGCKMNCSFCATGKQGFGRNLTAGEMLTQIQVAQNDLEIRISNVVLMGMGEPLDNYDNVVRFLKLASSEYALGIGMRHISLSTCGLSDKIYSLADLKLQLTLSVSLHAPNDKIRNEIMPINKKYNVSSLIKACKYYIKKTNRRISFEYTMIEGVNDTVSCAKELSRLLSGMICHVNLIPVNQIKDTEYIRSSNKKIQQFIDELAKHNIVATKRRTLGSDIDASCGQLRQKFYEEKK